MPILDDLCTFGVSFRVQQCVSACDVEKVKQDKAAAQCKTIGNMHGFKFYTQIRSRFVSKKKMRRSSYHMSF